MQNSNDPEPDVQLLLEIVGGEPLVQSGFENEEPEPGYLSDEGD
jgi:hypothetical protein